MASPYTKGQIELIKGIDADKRILWAQNDEYFFAAINGYYGYVIPNSLLLIDTEKISRFWSDSIISVLKTDDYKPVKLLGTVFSEGKTLAQLEGDNITAWVDMKLFKQFMGDYTYMAKSAVAPIHIYCNGMLYAVCCPTKRKQ